MKQYFDEKMFITLVITAVVVFLLQNYLTKKVIKNGKMSSYIGNDTVGYTEI